MDGSPAIADGATLLTGGKRPEGLPHGWYVEPTVFGNATNQMRIAPFGGYKCSGIGRDTGREGVESYFETKTINITPSMQGLFV